MTTETRATVTNQNPAGSRIGVRALVQIGMLSAIAVVLMLFEVPLPFAPSFYEIDFSEVPVLVGCFVMGPVAGAAIEFVKILLNFLINGTVTAGVGELGNFLIGCAFCVPAGIIYRKNRSRKGAIVGMGTAVNGHINSLTTLVLFAVVPFNLLKGVLVSLIVFLIYKKISPIFRFHQA